MSKQKALDADPRTIKQIIFTGKASENLITYYILKNLKTAFKNKTGKTLRTSLKMFDGNDLPHE